MVTNSYQQLPTVTNGYRLVTRIGGEDLELFGLDGTEIGEKNLSWRDRAMKSQEMSGKWRNKKTPKKSWFG